MIRYYPPTLELLLLLVGKGCLFSSWCKKWVEEDPSYPRGDLLFIRVVLVVGLCKRYSRPNNHRRRGIMGTHSSRMRKKGRWIGWVWFLRFQQHFWSLSTQQKKSDKNEDSSRLESPLEKKKGRKESIVILPMFHQFLYSWLGWVESRNNNGEHGPSHKHRVKPNYNSAAKQSWMKIIFYVLRFWMSLLSLAGFCHWSCLACKIGRLGLLYWNERHQVNRSESWSG